MIRGIYAVPFLFESASNGNYLYSTDSNIPEESDVTSNDDPDSDFESEHKPTDSHRKTVRLFLMFWKVLHLAQRYQKLLHQQVQAP